jgi:hypothetical protein
MLVLGAAEEQARAACQQRDLVAELTAPLPPEVRRVRQGDALYVQLPERALIVATALGAAVGTAFFYAAPAVLGAVPHVFAWASGTSKPHDLALPRAV